MHACLFSTPTLALISSVCALVVGLQVDGVFESWCDYSLLVDTAKPPEPVTIQGADEGSAVHGVRYRLLVEEGHISKPLPTSGKVRTFWAHLQALQCAAASGAAARNGLHQPCILRTVAV
jgi:hypothetical protein